MECRGLKKCDTCGVEACAYVHCVIDGKGGIICLSCWSVLNGKDIREAVKNEACTCDSECGRCNPTHTII